MTRLEFSSQVGTFFGLATGPVPPEFIDKWVVYVEHANPINFAATAIGLRPT